MCDVYIYNFVMSNNQNGENMISARPATLEAIEHRGGEPLMGSQIVVDDTQLDANGFLVGGEEAMDPVAAQICALEARAASRDKRAMVNSDEREKYMLSLESRELLKQARKLSFRLVNVNGLHR